MFRLFQLLFPPVRDAEPVRAASGRTDRLLGNAMPARPDRNSHAREARHLPGFDPGLLQPAVDWPTFGLWAGMVLIRYGSWERPTHHALSLPAIVSRTSTRGATRSWARMWWSPRHA